MSDRYAEFLKSKARIDHASGFIVTRDSLNAKLFDFQRDIVRWAIARGRAALFESTGLGKSFQQGGLFDSRGSDSGIEEMADIHS